MTNRRRAAKPAKSAPAGTSAQRLAALRAILKKRGLDGFVVPRADEHQGEYVPPCAERLAWLTGFTGSAGLAIVLLDRAAVFVDGRYTLQVAAQVDQGLYELRHLTVLDGSGEDLRAAFEYLDPDQVSLGGYCTEDCTRYWKDLVDRAVIPR